MRYFLLIIITVLTMSLWGCQQEVPFTELTTELIGMKDPEEQIDDEQTGQSVEKLTERIEELEKQLEEDGNRSPNNRGDDPPEPDVVLPPEEPVWPDEVIPPEEEIGPDEVIPPEEPVWPDEVIPPEEEIGPDIILPPEITEGSIVMVVNANSHDLHIRDPAGLHLGEGNIIGHMQNGIRGRVIDGPKRVSGLIWWEVQWFGGNCEINNRVPCIGWSAEFDTDGTRLLMLDD